MKTALSIAGSDPSGGAGIQADLKTMTLNGVFAMSVVTALTAQNTTGVKSLLEVDPGFLRDQMDMVFTDIRPQAVKIGMVSKGGLVEVIAQALEDYQAENIVVDPVMVATSGAGLMGDGAMGPLKDRLIPLANLVTPNIFEGEVLSGLKIKSQEDRVRAAKKIYDQWGTPVLLKGGHQEGQADDLLYDQGGETWFYGPRIHNPNNHGTGCTLSSAIAANLAKGYSLETSIRRAKAYINRALEAMLDLGQGSGPLNHAFDLGGDFAD
ncbi:MAG: bifunctional hydroxymethylpyrimidine kinase/phosphomethylpyrimidine kinase [Tissierellia bacterium]|nr:bifunctional hydroxymethylpyrimidine kinase/phosphomethylpyrimidine kinase [Tissierellia bacterium]